MLKQSSWVGTEKCLSYSIHIQSTNLVCKAYFYLFLSPLPQHYPNDLPKVLPYFGSQSNLLFDTPVSFAYITMPLSGMNLSCPQPSLSLGTSQVSAPRGHHLPYEALHDPASLTWNMIMSPTYYGFQNICNVLCSNIHFCMSFPLFIDEFPVSSPDAA